MRAPILVPTVLRNLVRKPATNLFPKTEPVPVPENFRGQLKYNVDKCVGCRMCVTVCPAGVFVYLPDIRKVALWTGRCVYCAQCVDVCPTGALEMSDEFLLASYDNYDDKFIPLKEEKIEEIRKKLEEQKKAKEKAKAEKAKTEKKESK
ncbi:4Fe-4S dicluster domain-containing protein [Thermococcus nautili]|uniref:Formate hydrogenlyase subunit 6/NADH:ubiquinone oxidoreductase 23 kD subunit (Chain I) n=1 Tax=Thermococcus nautili TaxID=195522 RepID=W8NWA5_9EURY|nr:4Fe-4S dicluster domain-containing protein [Thermococcus nautili]AHL23482.1 Formate hydrogenlyase subunit 6/NADH:ubiquinone oxidoreductase 23 kD subunit (chain I) [Thermococcus nautili]NJE49676.1 4Fe-4S dicluster domain-containing protein [Thermococcus sp. 9N3]CAI1492735.1 Formate hydrogenlyase subunit 6/NADH:ubiquinone oxidoreductase 23 kD subunit (Chain I) [Thermococcus nautili]